MPRQADIKAQAKALELAARGHLQKDIADELGVSERTVRRYLAEKKSSGCEAQARLSVFPAPSKQPKAKPKATPKPEVEPEPSPEPITNPIEALERISAARPDDPPIHLTFAQSTAIRLISLTDKAMAVLEETLDDPDVRRADKIKAAQIVGNWTNIGKRLNENPNQKSIAGEAASGLDKIFDLPRKPALPDLPESAHEKRMRLIELLGDLDEDKKDDEAYDLGLEEIRAMTEAELDEMIEKMEAEDEEGAEDDELLEHWQLHMCPKRRWFS